MTDLSRERANDITRATIDLFPMLPFFDAGIDEPAISLCASWYLTILAAKQFDDAQDEAVTEKIPLGLSLLGLAQQFLADLETDRASLTAILNAFGRQMSVAAASQSGRIPLRQISYERYFRDVVAKSGNTFAVGAWCGARMLLKEAVKADLGPYYRFGMAMGIVIQLRDDWSDWRLDLRRGKLTLPVIYALNNGRLQLSNAELDDSVITQIEETVIACNADAWCQRQVAQYQQEALVAIEQMPECAPWLARLVAMP
ncbi:MAG: polyprenyl synthetase family protein [Anaerolineales bacterium]|nr:polyprenyl synthetase family protein [Anaerolineales bacterium]